MPDAEQMRKDMARDIAVYGALDDFEQTAIRVEPAALAAGHQPRRFQRATAGNGKFSGFFCRQVNCRMLHARLALYTPTLKPICSSAGRPQRPKGFAMVSCISKWL